MLCVVEAGTAIAVALAPLAVGCVHIVAYSAMELLIFLLLSLNLWVDGWSARHGKEWIREYRQRTVFLAIPFFVFLAIGLLQMIPLPSAFVEKVSPNTTALYAYLGDFDAATDATWTPLSISLSATSSGLLKWMACIAAFFLAAMPPRGHGSEPRRTGGFLAVFFFVGVFEAVYGLSLYSSGSHRLLWFATVRETNCVTGTYVNRNHFAGLMNMCIPISAALLASNLPRMGGWLLRKGIFNPGLFRAWTSSYVLVGGTALMVLALMFSMSRMGQFSLVSSTVFAALLYTIAGLMEKKRRGRWMVLVLLLPICLAVLWGAWRGLEPVGQRWQTVEADYRDRSAIWTATARMAKESPLVGVGLGAFGLAFPWYKANEHSGIRVDHAHNDYLEILSEVGLPGLIPWLTFFLLFLLLSVQAWLRLRNPSSKILGIGCLSAALAILVHGLADFNLQIPANAVLLFIIMGFGWRIVNLSGVKQNANGDERRSA